MTRFLIAQRLAEQADTSKSRRMSLSALRAQVMGFTSVVNEASADAAEVTDEAAAVTIVEGDEREFEARRKELPSHFIIETEKLRRPGVFHPLAAIHRDIEALPAGIGAAIEVTAFSAGIRLEGALVAMYLTAYRGGFRITSYGVTNAAGQAMIPYNPSAWAAVGVSVVPRLRAWSGYTPITSPRVYLSLPALPRTGPLGWWHRSLGVNCYSERLGEGIRVGVIDTGVGPHPYLSHVKSAGAYLKGAHLTAPEAAADIADHGTHVTGIIGARPSSDSRDFAGIAPGAELVAARIYPGGGPPDMESGYTTNGDVAQALLALSRDEECDIINLSSGGLRRSPIEADRISAALNRGTIVICSVGNGSGPPVMFPAAEPTAVGVSAMGLTGGIPAGTLDMMSYPMEANRYSSVGCFAPSFNSIGTEIKCAGPGVGIISTVPARGADDSPYVAMSGTSMAAPAVAGTLAAILSKDPIYRTLPRTRARSLHAWMVFARTFRSLGLFQQYQGYGMPTIWV